MYSDMDLFISFQMGYIDGMSTMIQHLDNTITPVRYVAMDMPSFRQRLYNTRNVDYYQSMKHIRLAAIAPNMFVTSAGTIVVRRHDLLFEDISEILPVPYRTRRDEIISVLHTSCTPQLTPILTESSIFSTENMDVSSGEYIIPTVDIVNACYLDVFSHNGANDNMLISLTELTDSYYDYCIEQQDRARLDFNYVYSISRELITCYIADIGVLE